jgi:hypothetical protein
LRVGRQVRRHAGAALNCDDGQVLFTYRDRSDGDRRKTLSLPAEKFLSRFLLHVLPDRFPRIRHYGLLANRDKQQRLAHCRRLLGARPLPAEPAPQTAADWLRQWLNLDNTRCPCCGDLLLRVPLPPQPPVSLLAQQSVPHSAFDPWDTS